MASLTIHLAAANTYLENHPEENRSEFLAGSIEPDFAQDSAVSHHSTLGYRETPIKCMLGKVNLKECLQDADFSTSFGRGYFFHLITDDIFYRDLSQENYDYNSLSFPEFKEKLYEDYRTVNAYFRDKYHVTYPEKAKRFNIDAEGPQNFINIETVEREINYLKNLDLIEFVNSL